MKPLLEELYLPNQLKELSVAELEQVATEVRQKIIEVISKNGGHIAPSLGAVELSIALHTVFDSPRDKIIWDVSHQAYAHKILTGRLKEFPTLRQYGGISGFTKRSESPHDPFGTGHASTAVSAAVGMAQARDLKNENYRVVAVIGDGALSGGLALEGMNNALNLKTNLIVIINDNEMSISPNVGAYSRYFTKIRTNPIYNTAKERIEKIITRIPRIGVPLKKRAERLKDKFKHFLFDFKAGVIFEELGFKYLGPMDGHNITIVMSALQYAKDVKGPVLIHILTKKGKGYPPAENDPTKFHGTAPFDIKTGNPLKVVNGPSYTSVFGKTMVRLAESDSKVIAITAAMPDGTGLVNFADRFPHRFFDVGIAEEHAVTFAAGLATEGFKPVCAIYSTFLQRSYDQIIHDVCLQNLPVVFCLDRAGIVGEDGPTHHGLFDLAYLRSIPNLALMAPKDENELQHMLHTAVKHNGPIAVRYPRGSGVGSGLDKELKVLPVGKGEVVFKTAGPQDRKTTRPKVAIIAIGNMVYPSIEAAKILGEDNLGVTVINARFVKPLDRELILKNAKGADLVVTVEEGILQGGFGSAVLELLEENSVTDKKVKCIGLPDAFVPQGSPQELRKKYELDPQGIAQTIKASL